MTAQETSHYVIANDNGQILRVADTYSLLTGCGGLYREVRRPTALSVRRKLKESLPVTMKEVDLLETGKQISVI